MRTLALGLALALAACSAGNTEDGTSSGSGSGTSAGGSSGEGAGSTGSFDTGSTGTGNTVNPVGNLTGKVVAPEGTIPISGALVYLTSTLPPAIPDGVYCDKCVTIDPSVAHGFTNPDGTFDIPIYAPGVSYLVVQKGQFRRVRQITLAEGVNTADPTATRLPSRMDKANGDDIPKMVIQEGNYDDILTSLVQLGIDQDQITTWKVDCTISFPPQCSPGLFDDPATVSQYHIAFVPCGSCNGGEDGASQAIREFVAAGGKFYVTDWSYQWMTNAFPGYVDFDLVSNDGDACTVSTHDPQVTGMDPDLEAWLSAQGITNPTFEAAYTRITGTNSQPGTDVDGQPTMVTPKTWVTGNTPSGNKPLTVSFEQQCGRVLFSTYHSESSDGLLPQELALLYTILEVGVCVEAPIPR